MLWLSGWGAVDAVPGPHVNAEKVSGAAVVGIWRSKMEYERDRMLGDGRRIEYKVSCPKHWFVILKDVKGLTAQQRRAISGAFEMHTPADAILNKLDREKHLLLRFSAKRELEFREGSRLTFKGFRVAGDEWGVAMSFTDLEVAGP